MFYKNYKSNAWYQGRNTVIGIEIIGEETKNYRKQQQWAPFRIWGDMLSYTRSIYSYILSSFKMNEVRFCLQGHFSLTIVYRLHIYTYIFAQYNRLVILTQGQFYSFLIITTMVGFS